MRAALPTLALASAIALTPSAQESFSSGQNVAPAYEGWERNADGSFNLVFGYNYNNERNEEFYDEVDTFLQNLTFQPAANPRHRFTGAAIYQLPFGKGRPFLGSANRAVNAIVGGWNISGIYSYYSGQFLTPFWTGPDPTGTAFSANATRPVVTIRPDHLVWVVVGDRSKIEAGIRELNWGEIRFLDADGKPLASR